MVRPRPKKNVMNGKGSMEKKENVVEKKDCLEEKQVSGVERDGYKVGKRQCKSEHVLEKVESEEEKAKSGNDKKEYEADEKEDKVEEFEADEKEDKVEEFEADEKEDKVEVLKHPLANTWNMWLYTNESKIWSENLVMLTSFDTVEDFWCLYHHMKTASELKIGKDYSVFKNGVRPMWEDAANEAGGRWLINFDTKGRDDLDTTWLYVVLLLIGENFEYPEMICGAVVNVRVKSKIAVWVKNRRNHEAVMEVGKTLRDKLGLKNRLSFHVHNHSKMLYGL